MHFFSLFFCRKALFFVYSVVLFVYTPHNRDAHFITRAIYYEYVNDFDSLFLSLFFFRERASK